MSFTPLAENFLVANQYIYKCYVEMLPTPPIELHTEESQLLADPDASFDTDITTQSPNQCRHVASGTIQLTNMMAHHLKGTASGELMQKLARCLVAHPVNCITRHYQIS